MRLSLIIFALTVLFSFSLTAQTAKNKQKPLKFEISKTISNIERISNLGKEIFIKARITESLGDNFYWVEDNTGKLKVNISSAKISTVGNYDETTIFYLTIKVKNFREKTFTAINIKKAE